MLVFALATLVVPHALPAQSQTQTRTKVGSGPSSQTALPQPPRTQSIDAYIHQGWDTLSRSMTECRSLVDPKVNTAPVLYLPAGAPIPPELLRLRSHCRIQIAHLPHRIVDLGDVKEAEIPQAGLLYLPNRYVVPGGRFNEMFGWDSYFIILGLLRDNRADLARGMVENFFYEIENYGAVLNANRTYFLTRSQPPLLSSMIRAGLRCGACPRSFAGQPRGPENLAGTCLWRRPPGSRLLAARDSPRRSNRPGPLFRYRRRSGSRDRRSQQLLYRCDPLADRSPGGSHQLFDRGSGTPHRNPTGGACENQLQYEPVRCVQAGLCGRLPLEP